MLVRIVIIIPRFTLRAEALRNAIVHNRQKSLCKTMRLMVDALCVERETGFDRPHS